VLRPGGRLLFIEHVIDPSPTFRRLQQRLFNGLQQLLADGCHLDRDTEALLRKCEGLGVEEMRRLEVEGAGLIAPHLAGIMRRLHV
jgi:hypothetical protein